MTSTEETPQVIGWLETESGETTKLHRDEDSAIGRSENSLIVLDDKKVSRHHATIRPDPNLGFILFDMGSTNGTYVNGKRVRRPTLLNDRDRIELGSHTFTYRELRSETQRPEDSSDARTAASFNLRDCVLMLVDIMGYTQHSHTTPPDVLGHEVEDWVLACRRSIEDNNGVINKYLGDAVLAYWVCEDGREQEEVLTALGDLGRMRGNSFFDFRVVLHHGTIRLGGLSASGEESLIGEEVNYLFRAERLASELEKTSLVSGAAVSHLNLQDLSKAIGSYPLDDFDGVHEFRELTSEHWSKSSSRT